MLFLVTHDIAPLHSGKGEHPPGDQHPGAQQSYGGRSCDVGEDDWNAIYDRRLPWGSSSPTRRAHDVRDAHRMGEPPHEQHARDDEPEAIDTRVVRFRVRPPGRVEETERCSFERAAQRCTRLLLL